MFEDQQQMSKKAELPEAPPLEAATTDFSKDEDVQQTVTASFDESYSSIVSERLTHNPDWVTWLSKYRFFFFSESVGRFDI